jgi:hypothetical protein
MGFSIASKERSIFLSSASSASQRLQSETHLLPSSLERIVTLDKCQPAPTPLLSWPILTNKINNYYYTYSIKFNSLSLNQLAFFYY